MSAHVYHAPAPLAEAVARRRASPTLGRVKGPRSALVGWLVARVAQLRFPVLFGVTAALFAIDLVVPDVIPFADELMLGLATALLASWKQARVEPAPAPAPQDRR